ncbi:MAG: hypothetical protein ACLPVO_19325 [Desulfomonilaceae bacterium]
MDATGTPVNYNTYYYYSQGRVVENVGQTIIDNVIVKTWMKFAGSGSWDTSEYRGYRSNYFGNGDTYSQTSATPNGTLNTRNLGGGVTASLSF